ncbi:MAG: GTPase ObgE [Nitrospirales bacterium]|nr:GTPase ObgE [Nitrospirales bacterium]
MFIDQARIFIKAGDGGTGHCSFRREKFAEFGGPNGGDGGDGGDVVFVASNRVSTLLDLRYQKHYEARSGVRGLKTNCHGANGSDIVIALPVGTLVKTEDGDIIADLIAEGQTAIVAKGGKGGKGNARFATSTNRAPRQFEPGTPGEERWVNLELKLLADVGLVGFPNAGKSTLISAISSAHPEIASYPFTTLRPHLGVVEWMEHSSFVVADIPGLIEGAHEGKGLGIKFLRHIQRTAFLLYLVDITEWISEDPIVIVETLQRELQAFDPELLERPFAIVATKIDTQGNGQHLEALREYCATHHYPFFPISAVTREGLPSLVTYLGKAVLEAKTSCASKC